ncbi:asparaginase-domain-containing protein, partial [Coemansia mojavensis]
MDNSSATLPVSSSSSNDQNAANIAAHHYSETADFQRMRASLAEAITQGVSKVLVIYTGGTIGMKHDKINGYSPAKGYLMEKLKSIGRFHDPEGFADFDIEFHRSNDADHIASRLSNALNRNAREPSPKHPSSTTALIESAKRRLQDMSRGLAHTPLYCFLEYDPLLDSCNMDMTDWVRIVTDIEKFYYTFDAFIILHGTDTMSYTASALSFMLQNLGKSVIVTGSQVPIAEVRNDGIENFLGALTIAGHFVIPEVALYFNNKLFRGNRCVKVDAMDFDAFSSPNLAPLVRVGVDIEVSWPEVLRPNAIEPFYAHKQMNANVATLRLFPGMSPIAVRAFLNPPIQGVVLETFGAGNAPDANPAILEALSEASDRGVVIVNVTQCQRGNVSDLYATARGLTRAKVVPGRDMTSECALTKLSYLLGRGFAPEKCRDMMGRSLRGELTVVHSQSRPIFYSNRGRAHTFTQFVSPYSSLYGSVETRVASNDDHPSRETPTERASIYRAFYPVLLCAAAATGDLQGMYLLEEATNKTLEVTCYDYTGQTPLHCAVRSGQLPCARFLLKRGASVHVLSRQGHTPLFAAISSRHPEMVNLLLQAGAHFSDAEIRDIMLSMQNAVSRGDIEFVKLAVRAGFDINTNDHEGRTILFFAVISSQVEIVEYLLSLPGVSIEHWDHWEYSPMDYI